MGWRSPTCARGSWRCPTCGPRCTLANRCLRITTSGCASSRVELPFAGAMPRGCRGSHLTHRQRKQGRAGGTMSESAGSRIRESFSGRNAFILVAIGSAVGLGNIWRFPYVTYENGGGAFLIPYLVALLTAGIPILLFDYGVGYKLRGLPPLGDKRLQPRADALTWLPVGVCLLIAIYYAAIIAWSAMYAWFSLTQAWGDDAEGFFFGRFLEYDGGGTEGSGISVDFVAQAGWPMLVVWVVLLLALGSGVRRG